MGWLWTRNGQIELAGDVAARILGAEAPGRNLVFAEALLGTAGGPYERVFAHYLARFGRSEGELVFWPDVEARLRDAGVRDFFMDLGAVHHRPDGDYFVLDEAFAPWTLWARNVLGLSAKELAQHAQDRSELGLSAEMAALDWEKARVGETHRHLVRHISQESPAACFDIQSVTLTPNEVEPRFIEVKAVASESFEFHWSGAEIEAAQILGPRYFLYLLPVRVRGVFDVGRMEIVQDAFNAVYKNSAHWLTTVADTVCRKNESRGS